MIACLKELQNLAARMASRRYIIPSKKMLCTIYDDLGQPAKVEACSRELMPTMEHAYGPNRGALAPLLAVRAKALRQLGRISEAEEVERRIKGLQQVIASTN